VALKKQKLLDEYKRPIEVRDFRDKAFFMMDDEYFNGFSKICGAYATLVYLALCRHVGKDQTCWPSVERMADHLAISHVSVLVGLKSLEDHKIIIIKRTKGSKNYYGLIHKKHWAKKIYHKIVSGKASVSSLGAFKELNGMGKEE
jgi:hypothetical protein